MNLHIKAKNLELTPSIKEWIEEKIGDLDTFVARHEKSGPVLCEVEVSRTSRHHNKGDVFRAEVNLHLPDHRLNASVEHADVRTALDMVRDILHRDLMKYKTLVGRTGLAARHMAHSSKKALAKLMWWRNK